MAAPILPTAAELTTPMIDAIVAAWPPALQYINGGGNWYSLIAMTRGQLGVALRRLADEVRSTRLRTARGQTLASLCASEFDTRLPSDPQTAVGTVTLLRGGFGPFAQGVVKKGTLLVKTANPNGIPLPIQAASYTTIETVFAPQGSTFMQLNFQATTPGAAANNPIIEGGPLTIAPAQPLYDPAWTVQQTCEAAGGSSGIVDPVLIAAAMANAVGQYGPTDGAVVAGMLATQAVRHYAFFPASGLVPYSQAFVADESWSSGGLWTSTIAQEIATNWQGFGCRTRFGEIVNQVVQVSPSIMLKSTDDLNYTDAIDQNVRAAISAYFDRSPNWWLYRNAGLVSAIGAADSRILRCTSAAVIDQLSGTPIPDTVNNFSLVTTVQLVHYMSANDAVTTTYFPPS